MLIKIESSGHNVLIESSHIIYIEPIDNNRNRIVMINGCVFHTKTKVEDIVKQDMLLDLKIYLRSAIELLEYKNIKRNEDLENGK